MGLRASARGHAHQTDNHAITFDAGAVGSGIVGAAEDVIDLGEIENVFAGTGALGTRRAGGGLAGHWCPPTRGPVGPYFTGSGFPRLRRDRRSKRFPL